MIYSYIILSLVLPATLTASPARLDRLSNGLNIVLVENHSVPMIAANIVIHAGSRDESWHAWGAAHFLEHLLFNGTRNRTQEQIYDEFDRLGAYRNAHTGSNFTDFMLLTEAGKFQAGLPILADMVFNSTLPVHKFEKERGIVMEEIAKSLTESDNPGRLFKEALFGQTPLAREVLGTVESIARLERDSVLAFYRAWYAPNNALLFVTGDFSADTMTAWLDNLLKVYPPRELPLHPKLAAPDLTELAGLGLVERPMDVEKRHLFIALKAPAPRSPDFPALMMLSRLLDKRLEANLPAGVGGGTNFILDPDVNLFQISASAPKDGISAMDLVERVDRELKKLAEQPVEAAEIARVARQYKSDLVFNSERLHYFGILYSQYWALVGWDCFASWEDRLGKLTQTELRATAQKWLLSPDRFVMAVEPAIQKDTAQAVVGAGVFHKEFLPYGGEVIVRNDPSARVFAVHILLKDRWQWDNRLKTPGAVDLLHRALAEQLSSGQPLGACSEELGANIKTADDPKIPFDDYYTSPEYSFVRLEILPERWQDGVRLLADLLTAPATDKILTVARERVKTAKFASERSPAGAGAARLRNIYFSGQGTSAPVYGDVSKLTAADLEKLRRFYFHPANMIISVAGPTEAKQVVDVVKNVFYIVFTKSTSSSDWPWTPPPATCEEVYRDTLALGKPQGAVVMGKILFGISPSERAALTVANAYLSERMSAVLRESRGLAYALGSSVSMWKRSEDIAGWWELSISTRPENLATAEAGIRELLTELQTHNFTSPEVEKLASAVAGRILMRDMSRIGQAYSLGVGELYWQNPNNRSDLLQALNDIQPEAVQSAARKYLTETGLTTVIVK